MTMLRGEPERPRRESNRSGTLPPAFARRDPPLAALLTNGSSNGSSHGAGLLNRARNVVRAAYGFRGVKKDVLQQRAQLLIDAMTVGLMSTPECERQAS